MEIGNPHPDITPKPDLENQQNLTNNQLSEELNGLNMDFSIKECSYQERTRNLTTEAVGEVKSTKFFPVFTDERGKEQIFKPLSKTKPLCTPLFAYSEVFWSNILHHYFDPKTPVYKLAECKGISEDNPKYYGKGTLVPNMLKEGQKLVNLLEYFRAHPDPKVDIDKYINYAMKNYYYFPILESDIFSKNRNLGKELAQQILYSVLMKNMNFHYENVAFIEENGEIQSLAPAIDHEFSLFFLFPERDDMQYYDRYTTIMRTEKGPILLNLECIKENYPDVVHDFVKKLRKFKTDLQNNQLQEKNLNLGEGEYLRPFSTYDWEIGDARFKQNNEEGAQKLEKIIEKHNIDLNNFSSQLQKKLLKHCYYLENLLIHPIEVIEVDA